MGPNSGNKRDNYVLKGPGHGMDKIITLCPLFKFFCSCVTVKGAVFSGF